MRLLWDSSDMTVLMTLREDGESFDYNWEAGRGLARDMLGYLRDRLAEHDRSFEDITGIGVFRGPGSFTGLRIGITVLNTLADANRIPIVGAVGEDWKNIANTRLDQGENDGIVLPEYGAGATITTPKK